MIHMNDRERARGGLYWLGRYLVERARQLCLTPFTCTHKLFTLLLYVTPVIGATELIYERALATVVSIVVHTHELILA